MSRQQRTPFAFRPSLVESNLEERLVLSAATAIHASAVTPAPAPSPFTPLAKLTQQQVRAGYITQARAAEASLQNAVRNDLVQLYANGAPTPQQLANFRTTVASQLDATTFRLASQAALLPGNTLQMMANMQNSLLGSATNSLLARVQAIIQAPQYTNSIGALSNILSQQINRTFNNNTAALNNYFNMTNLNRLSVNSTGQMIPLQQYFGNQIQNQLGNSLGALAQSYTTQANALLFPTDGSTPSTSAVNAFDNSFATALNTTGFQLANDIALFNGGTGVLPQTQQSLFGSGSGALYNSIIGLPNDATNFTNNVNTAFNNGFTGLSNTVSYFFGPNGSLSPNLPTGSLINVFNAPFDSSSFNSGFNNGFGSGSIGFGQPSNGFDNMFSTGFNSFVTNTNTGYGLQTPTPLSTSGL